MSQTAGDPLEFFEVVYDDLAQIPGLQIPSDDTFHARALRGWKHVLATLPQSEWLKKRKAVVFACIAAAMGNLKSPVVQERMAIWGMALLVDYIENHLNNSQ